MNFSIIPDPIKHILRPVGHILRSHAHALRHGYPARKLKIISVGGTDGKTTTSLMLFEILRTAGIRTALATTVWLALSDEKKQRNHTKMTSLPPWKLQKFLADCVTKKAEIVILESSSVALHQHRMAGMRPFIAIITNFSREEMAYHRTMKNYANAKKLALKNAKNIILPANLRDWTPRKRDLTIFSEISDGILQIPGDFNRKNAAAALAAAKIIGIPQKDAEETLKKFTGVLGRMQKIPDTHGRHIFVDYAVTPAAFETVLTGLRQKYPKSKIIHVFGATGGGRDREKRPILGKITAQNTDKIILTDEESYGEKVDQILANITAGIPKNSKSKAHIIPDRLDALKKGLSLCKKGDILLATGMGGELTRNVAGIAKTDSDTTKNLGGRDIPWDEADILKKNAAKITPKT